MEKKKSLKGEGLVIALDAKRAVLNNTGLGNYSRYAVNIMSAAFPSASFRLYTPRVAHNDRLEPLLLRDNVSLVAPELRWSNSLSRAFWRTVDLPLDLKADGVTLYHGLSNEIPLTIKGVCPTVVTIHDLIYRRIPENYRPLDRRLYDLKYRRSARIATRVIAISECTKRDLIKDYSIAPEKIDVIYQGIDPVFSLPIDTARRMEIRAKYSLPERYIISVGTVEDRKNQLMAVKTLERMPADVVLIIVGRMKGSYAETVKRYIASHGLSERVRQLVDVPFPDIPALYADALFSTYTSRYEGFGLPVVESLASGTPVIAATGSCLEEAGGEGALYVHPDDIDAFAENALRLLDDSYLRNKLVDAGRRHIRKFSAENFAKSTMACYNKAIMSFLL